MKSAWEKGKDYVLKMVLTPKVIDVCVAVTLKNNGNTKVELSIFTDTTTCHLLAWL